MKPLLNFLGVFGLAVLAVFLILSFQSFMAGGGILFLADHLTTFTTIFLGIFIQAAPFLLLGILAYLTFEAVNNELYMADADGNNPRSAIDDPDSPSWMRRYFGGGKYAIVQRTQFCP